MKKQEQNRQIPGIEENVLKKARLRRLYRFEDQAACRLSKG
jgi:hypothetical protein